MAELLHYNQEKNKLLLNRIAPHIETDGSIMKYNGEIVSIENMDLFLFFESNALFYQSVNAIELSEEDIFSILRIHALAEVVTKKEEKNDFSNEDQKKKEIEGIVKLIPYADFKDLIRRDTEYTEKEKKSVELYLNFFEDLIYYEDYLLPELALLLQDYRLFCENVEMQVSEEKSLTIHEQKACDRLKNAIDRHTDSKVAKKNDQRLVFKLPDHYLDSTGSSETILIILAVLLIVFILAGITLSLIV